MYVFVSLTHIISLVFIHKRNQKKKMIDLTEEQIERYSRHILLQDVGLEGQEKLLNAKVLIIGAGGLGSPVALYLAAAGVGHIGIVDADVVDLSNLQRQVIHQTKDLNTPKVESAKEKKIGRAHV